MSILSTAVSLLRLFIREPNYRELSEEWFDDVWEHLDKVSSGRGELYEDDDTIYRRFVALMSNKRYITITDDSDSGARIDDIKLDVLERVQLDATGYVVIQRYW